MSTILYNFGNDYNKFKLNDDNLEPNPFDQFKIWFDQAIEEKVTEPTAMTLSTASAQGKPSSRVVLLKKYDDRGFVFFTNYDSRKGKEIAENPQASLLFFWCELERQIRIAGKIEKISHEESEEYFQTRDYTSRLGAWASHQSRPLSSRFSLMRKVAGLMIKYPNNVPLPDHWGGYRVIPDEFEFWQGRKSRLHDRFRFTLENGVWSASRLNP